MSVLEVTGPAARRARGKDDALNAVAAGENPDRLRSEASFARGVQAPLILASVLLLAEEDCGV